ncbi:rhodanese-like domain-containing protein [Occallatibacter savannae]|uniref:rhodanese-like domain-containing protein n=1 Tax=Occallatibacter savannae TaxID=1002691 RepID=UPI000D69E904|nr:rhodanese-like domain-containing protein [Occallatibacter savannae]
MNSLLKCVVFLSFVGFTVGAQAQFSSPASAPLSASTVPQAQQMQPAELVTLLKTDGAERPVVLQVGSRVMFQQAHIPGSKFAGPGSQPSGLALLKKVTGPIKKDQLIVIYCGCCPWGRCPNIGPAYKQLHDLGFTNVKALYLANNFGDDWASKGYPTDRGE